MWEADFCQFHLIACCQNVSTHWKGDDILALADLTLDFVETTLECQDLPSTSRRVQMRSVIMPKSSSPSRSFSSLDRSNWAVVLLKSNCMCWSSCSLWNQYKCCHSVDARDLLGQHDTWAFVLCKILLCPYFPTVPWTIFLTVEHQRRTREAQRHCSSWDGVSEWY